MNTSNKITEILTYYATPGPITDPGDCGVLLTDLPADIAGLVEMVQGLMVHIFWAERYGLKLSPERQQEINLRWVSQMLSRIRELSGDPLQVKRPLEQKLVGNCRDHSTLLVTLLRHQGIPARARCGFGVYFMPNHYEDHWVVEYWCADEGRWVMVDPQLDPFQGEALGIQFDTLDMPPGQFIPAGQGWQMCRQGQADPDSFGIFDLHGMWFIRGNLVRDLAALNKVELLPWDGWGLGDKDEQALTREDLALLDRAAALTLAGNESFAEMRAFYQAEDELRVPPVIRSYSNKGMQLVDL
ncbi:MAG: transglutaminase domain-containing protein, partial [Anaerolineae bacterium]|nr:transglutaminase domain-containing protein [Anaerolineae bacterium]